MRNLIRSFILLFTLIIGFMAMAMRKKINIYGQEDGISAETAKKAVRKRQEVKKITNVGMGMKGKTPVWEVTYLNAYGNLCYDIIAFKNGDIIKTIQNI